MPKQTDETEEVKQPKGKKMIVNIVDQIPEDEKIIVRFDNIILGKADYYSTLGKYPNSIAMNSKVFKKMLVSGLINTDKCLDIPVIIDNSLKNSDISFA